MKTLLQMIAFIIFSCIVIMCGYYSYRAIVNIDEFVAEKK